MADASWPESRGGAFRIRTISKQDDLSLNRNQVLVVFIVIGLLAALVSFKHRYSAEARNRRVELVIDWTDAQQLANTTSVSIDNVLKQLRAAGATTVAVNEDTLDTLRVNGIVGYKRKGNDTLLTFTPEIAGQRDRVADAIRHKTGLTLVPIGTNGLQVSAPWTQFNVVPIGLDEVVVQTIRRDGLLVAPRLLNYTGVTPDSINWELAQVKQQCGPNGLGPVIFSGSAVLGFRGAIPATAIALRALDMTYGSVEFAKTFGDDDLSRMADDRTVRVHSIGVDEMGTMDEPTAEERFVRAARERNIRVCYVRLFINGLEKDSDVIDANTKFLTNITKGMKIARLTVGDGPAHPFADDPKPGLVLRLMMGLGVAGGILLLIRLFTGLEGKPYYLIFGVVLLLCLGLAAPGTSPKGREILALLAACTFPGLGLSYFGKPKSSESLSLQQTLVQAFLAYCRITLVTIVGVLFVVGILNGRLFFLKVESFLGVKLVIIAPILLSGIYYGLGLSDLASTASWKVRWERMKAVSASVMSHKLLLGQVIIGVIALAALAIVIARSGNDPGVGVSMTELKVRALLDKYLLVRPRTKEFLFGHPALLLAMAFTVARKYRRWILPLIAIGAIGQGDIIDTFCHLHSPLFLSILRAGIGWVLGAIFAVIVYVVIDRIEKRASLTARSS